MSGLLGKHPSLAEKFDIATMILTYKCPLSCQMCFFGCNPKRREMLSEEIAYNVIDDVARLGIKHVGFAGGEPVLRLGVLCKLIERCKRRNMVPIVITSGYWGKNKKQAIRVAYSLRSAGLECIQISLDDEHLKFMTIEDFCNALAVCKDAGFKDIKIIGTSIGNKENFTYLAFYVEHVLGISTKEVDLVDRYCISHGNFYGVGKKYSLESLEEHIKLPDCFTEMMVDVNGDIYPCCQNFVGRIGNLHDDHIDNIVDRADNHRMCKLLQKRGPANFARYLDYTFGTDFTNQVYSHWCEVCARIFENTKFENILCEELSDGHRRVEDPQGEDGECMVTLE